MGIWQLIRYIFRNSLNSYKNSFRMSLFGYFWAIFQPLALVAIYSLVFGHIVKTKLGVLGEYDYAVFVSTALLPWLVFASGVQSGTSAIVSHSNYIKKIPMPIFVYPAKASIEQLYGLVGVFVVLSAILLLYGLASFYIVYAIPVFVLLGIVCLSFSMILSVVAVFIKDTLIILGFLLQLLMWGAPVVYPLEIIPVGLQWIILSNPLYYYFDSIRLTMLHNTLPPMSHCIIMSVFAIFSFCVGLFMCTRAESRIRDIV